METKPDLISVLITVYFIISQFATLYFWWEWAHHHSFLSTVFLGPVVSEIKGLLWIFFIW